MPEYSPKYCIALESEKTVDNVSSEDRRARDLLIDALLALPKEIITNIREIQPESGCFNQCSFCGETSGAILYRMSNGAINNLFAALKFAGLTVAKLDGALSEKGTFANSFVMPDDGLVGYGQKRKRKGVIYPYLDNDIASYPFIDRFVAYASEDLGVKVRISTVGYSRHNKKLQRAHESINRYYGQCIDALRFSFTPYTYGWCQASENNRSTSREELVLDIANTLKTYRPTIDYLLERGKDAAFEFRFRPLVKVGVEFNDVIIAGHRVLQTGPYILIMNSKNRTIPKAIVDGGARHMPKVNGRMKTCTMVISDALSNGKKWQHAVKETIKNRFEIPDWVKKVSIVRTASICTFMNYDGHYFGTDVGIGEQGVFSKQFYPRTEKRPIVGYIDSERYFLNQLLSYKEMLGFGKKEQIPSARFLDVHNVIDKLAAYAARLSKVDHIASRYITTEILPLVASYAKILKHSGFDAEYFFNPKFTINAGSVRNIGRAFGEYSGLASRQEMAVTPEHEARYGKTSFFASEGRIWRIAPLKTAKDDSALLIELRNFGKRTEKNRGIEKRYVIPFGKGIDRLEFESQINQGQYIVPGQKLNSTLADRCVGNTIRR